MPFASAVGHFVQKPVFIIQILFVIWHRPPEKTNNRDTCAALPFLLRNMLGPDRKYMPFSLESEGN